MRFSTGTRSERETFFSPLRSPLPMRRIPLEAIVWTAGLAGLAILGPSLDGHITICVPSLLGFDGCWGCGLGRAIGYLFRGDFQASWNAHPLAIPAVVVLLYRITTLLLRSRTFAGAPHG